MALLIVVNILSSTGLLSFNYSILLSISAVIYLFCSLTLPENTISLPLSSILGVDSLLSLSAKQRNNTSGFMNNFIIWFILSFTSLPTLLVDSNPKNALVITSLVNYLAKSIISIVPFLGYNYWHCSFSVPTIRFNDSYVKCLVSNIRA